MVIACPDKMRKAFEFAQEQDRKAVSAAFRSEDPEEFIRKHARHMDTLMSCLCSRLKYEASIGYGDGQVPPPRRGIRLETCLFEDYGIEHSFFFRENWVNDFGMLEDVMKDRWILTMKDGTTKYAYSEEEMAKLLKDSESCIFNQYRVEGMCGGIIYHRTYDDHNNPTGFGEWSTHT